MATLNAEATLSSALESVKWAQEIIIVDSNSTDQTLKIAQLYTTKIYQHKFDGYGNQKQFGLNQCTQPWILVLDSDEQLSLNLQAEIQSLVTPTAMSKFKGYEMPRELLFLGHRIRTAGGVDFPLRLFQKGYGKFNGAPVHERLVIEGKVGRLQGWLRHNSYLTLESYFEKLDRYTSIAAQEALEKGKKISPFKIVAGFPIMFFKFYFLKGGFKDGLYGWLWSLLSAIYPVVKYTKLKHLQWKSSTSANSYS